MMFEKISSRPLTFFFRSPEPRLFYKNPLCGNLYKKREDVSRLSPRARASNSRSVRADIKAHEKHCTPPPPPHSVFCTKVIPPKRRPPPRDGSVLRPDHHMPRTKLSSVSSLGVVVCELPLLEGVVGVTGVEAKCVALSSRLHAHVVGHELRYEVLRQG